MKYIIKALLNPWFWAAYHGEWISNGARMCSRMVPAAFVNKL